MDSEKKNSEEKDLPDNDVSPEDTESSLREKRGVTITPPKPVSRPNVTSAGFNSKGEETLIVTGPGKKPGFGPGSINADLGKNKQTPLQKENSAAIHQTAKLSTEQLKKTQAEQAAKAKAQADAQVKAKAERDALTAKLKKESDERLKKNREQDAKKAAERAKAEADRKAVEAKVKADAEARKKEQDAVKDAIKFTADFHKEVFKVYGEKAEQLAQALEKQAKGKKIRNAGEAAKAWEKHRANINKKINAKDREAIAKYLESIDVNVAAKNFTKFSKAFYVTGKIMDAYDLYAELTKAVKTDNWRPFYVKTETLALGLAASQIVAFTFSVIAGGPIGLLGYGLIIAGVGLLVNDTIVEEANKFWGI